MLVWSYKYSDHGEFFITIFISIGSNHDASTTSVGHVRLDKSSK
mgnify:CR=1 FL=1